MPRFFTDCKREERKGLGKMDQIPPIGKGDWGGLGKWLIHFFKCLNESCPEHRVQFPAPHGLKERGAEEPSRAGSFNSWWCGTGAELLCMLQPCLICLSVQGENPLLRSGICFTTLKPKGAPLIPFIAMPCGNFTWNCCSCLLRK